MRAEPNDTKETLAGSLLLVGGGDRPEAWLAEAGKAPSDSDLAEMDALWNRAKAEDKAKAGSKTPTGTPG